MRIRGRRLRFTAVLAVVVLALTGFSRGHGHGHGSHGSHGSGGGCSSSQQDHDSSSSATSGGGSSSSYDDSYDDSSDDSYDDLYGTGGGYTTRRPTHRPTATPSGGSNGTALDDGTVRLISCATGTRPYATVEITNPNSRAADFQARVTFYDAEGTVLVTNHSAEVFVPAEGRTTARVTLGKSFRSSIDHCEADPEAQLRS
jgi:hypothetical protein